MLEVDRGRLLRKSAVDTLSVCVALSECLESRYSLFELFVIFLAIFIGGIWGLYKPLPRPSVEYILVKSCMGRFVRFNSIYKTH
jgi:hypothetical protein